MDLIISTKGISINEDNVKTIRDWSQEKKTTTGPLKKLFEVQQYHGFSNCNRRFIPKYSEKVEPLKRCTNKVEPWVLEFEQQLAFENMITTFTKVPAFRDYDHTMDIFIDIDASD